MIKNKYKGVGIMEYGYLYYETINCPNCMELTDCEFVDVIDTDMLMKGGEIIEKWKCSKCNEYFYIRKEIEVTDMKIYKKHEK